MRTINAERCVQKKIWEKGDPGKCFSPTCLLSASAAVVGASGRTPDLDGLPLTVPGLPDGAHHCFFCL